jgi:AhpD family alkylhydroperoxidase
MEQSIQYYDVAPEALRIMMEMEKYIGSTKIDPKLRELVKIRASQINGWAFCLNMHTTDAANWVKQRLYCVSAWDDCDFYTDAENTIIVFCNIILFFSLIKTLHSKPKKLILLNIILKAYRIPRI